MKPTLIFIVLALVSGCAGNHAPPEVPADHPANAAGPEAIPRARTRTLDPATADPIGRAGDGSGQGSEEPER